MPTPSERARVPEQTQCNNRIAALPADQQAVYPPADRRSQWLSASAARYLANPDRWERGTQGAHSKPATIGRLCRPISHWREARAHQAHTDLTTVLSCGIGRARNFV